MILFPEITYNIESIVRTLRINAAKGKRSGIIVAAERIGDTRELLREIEKRSGAEVRLSITGYAQRGGKPTARSRLIANLFGNKAVELILNKGYNMMVALKQGKISNIDIERVCRNKKPLELNLMKLAYTLAT